MLTLWHVSSEIMYFTERFNTKLKFLEWERKKDRKGDVVQMGFQDLAECEQGEVARFVEGVWTEKLFKPGGWT